ncbi:membrane protein insertase YidC [Bacteroides sp. 224]|uniref:membrane protein insertase YidC n=1 Tax=Bacteroides sp. 224 TaxID=2302936 RepID=UPI0013D51F6E|nr:membrane protein insertase YidC [Bacteroides sp. 224]NDV65113.1 membrane protein insertase YidC [Bacteroides sp. 224]
MDKNTIIGLVLIGLLLIGFSYFSRPNEEQVAAWQRYNDSIAVVQREEEALRAKTAAALANEKAEEKIDSTSTFFPALQGEESFTTIENELVKVVLSNKGGRVYSATLKEYYNQEKEPLVLFSDKDASMNFYFYNKTGALQTKDYYFKPINQTANSVVMRLIAADDSYIDFAYTLLPESYMVDFSIKATGMEDKLSSTTNYIDIAWSQRARQQERGSTYENRLSNLSYKLTSDDSDHLSESKDEDKSIEGSRLDWIAFKNQFFSSVFIADQSFEKGKLKSRMEQQGSGYIKNYAAEMSTFFDPKGNEATTMHFYFGPNHYKTLKAFDKGRDHKWELDNLVYLGWPVVRQINQWFTINIFDWLSSWGLSMGIVLLLMTIIVKIVVFPATWKTFISSAKMRVLKPQIDKINEKYPKQEDAMKKQQEVMGLYSQYGVSPMGGCLPMLLQFPILMALFMFVPSAIEFRQESFLWAADLSTYDDIIKLPFKIPFLGNHLSLFCLLMTITTILNTKFTMDQQNTGQQQVPGMKWMMYLMPVMFLFVLNDFPAGLNYYYFISTLISVITMIILRKTTNEEKLLAQLETNKSKKKTQKKSGFAARLEAMQKEQERLLQEKAKQNKK